MQGDNGCGGYDKRAFVAEFYDLVPAYAGRADQSFYLDLAVTLRGPILELGCGTGRLLIPVPGIESSGWIFPRPCRLFAARNSRANRRRFKSTLGSCAASAATLRCARRE